MNELTEAVGVFSFGKLIDLVKLVGAGVILWIFMFWMFSVPHIHSEDKMTLFVSEGCPHCIKVREFIAEHNMEDNIVVLNIHTDDGAAEKYTDFVAEHEIPLSEQGTPTLIYDGDRWVVGDTPIIDFLAERYDVQEGNNTSNDSANDASDGDDLGFTIGDYLIFGIGLIVVSSVVGYGIVNLVNERGKS